MKQKTILTVIAIITMAIFMNANAQPVTLPPQWNITNLGGLNGDIAFCVRETQNGDFIIAGETQSTNGIAATNHGGADMLVVKLNAQGTTIWSRCYGGSNADGARHIEPTTDGGFIICGYTNSNNGDIAFVTNTMHFNTTTSTSDFWVVKIDTDGNIQWQRCYGGFNNEIANDIKQTADGGYIIGGNLASAKIVGQTTNQHALIGIQDFWAVKINAIGNVEFENNYGKVNTTASCFSIQQTQDFATAGLPLSGYIMAGDFSQIVGTNLVSTDWVQKVNINLVNTWNRSYTNANTNAHISSIIQTNTGGYVFAGYSNEMSLGLLGGINQKWVVGITAAGVLDANGKNSYNVANNQQQLINIVQTNDNGYISAGFSDALTAGGGINPIFSEIVKLANNRSNATATRFAFVNTNAANLDNGLSSIIQTHDCGYVATGSYVNNTPNWNEDLWIMRFQGTLAAITGTPTVCIGATTTLANTTTGGVWSSTNTAIATVNATTGVVTGVAAGTATIYYTTGNCFVTMEVTVGVCNVCLANYTTPPTLITGGATQTINNIAYPSGSYYIANNITITGTVSFTNAEVLVAEGVQITVADGAKLFINGSHFYSCEKMWKGIQTIGTGYVNISKTLAHNSFIEDAKVAVDIHVSPNNNWTSLTSRINNTLFNRNNISVRFNKAIYIQVEKLGLHQGYLIGLM
jgi:Bacterial Ig-like domain (group 2)